MIRITCINCKKIFRIRKVNFRNRCRKCANISSPNRSHKIKVTKKFEAIPESVNKINKRKKK